MNTADTGIFGQEIPHPATGKIQAPLFHEPEPATIKLPNETPADGKIAEQYDAKHTPELFQRRRPRRSLVREVHCQIRAADIPYVSVDEAKKALFANAKLRAFHFVVYSQRGCNWMVLVGEMTTGNRAMMNEWQNVFGDGFCVVFAMRRASGIVYRYADGKPASFDHLRKEWCDV